MALYIPVGLALLYFASLSQQDELLNECERGVKRHHPSQANVFQVFTRRNLLKQWMDYECEKFTIFDPRKCECVERPQEQPSKKRRLTSPERQNKNRAEREMVTVDRGLLRSENVKVTVDRGLMRSENVMVTVDRGLMRSENVKQSNEPLEEKNKNEENPSNQIMEKKVENVLSNEQDSLDKQDDSFDDKSKSGCHLHQPSPDSPSLFERWTDGRWVTEDCNFPFYTGLMWNQDKCRCEWGPNRTAPVAVHQNVVPAACLMMFHLTFDEGKMKEVGRGVWIKLHNKEDASVVTDSTAVGGYSGSFRGASMSIPFFKSNIIGPIFHIGFMYKLCPGNPDTDIILVHNDCKESFDGPSLVVSYQAWKQQIIVAMRTEESDVPIQEYCTVKNASSQKSWMKVDIRYQDNYLEVTTNDEVCISSEKFYGPLATNNCPLTLLSESFCGNLDEVIITRGCTEAHAIS